MEEVVVLALTEEYEGEEKAFVVVGKVVCLGEAWGWWAWWQD
jgi:hypothetical protein